MGERIIFHIDVNSAFLSWEAAYRVNVLGENIDLREVPAAIGGDQEKRRGVILAKSTPAKKYQIQTGEPIINALRKCPELIVVKPNFDLYVKCSKAFMAILKEYTPDVEQYSIDEAFMDMTGTEALYGQPVQVAHIIKNRIEQELGFTVNVGISTNKLLAKMASDFEKPNLVHTLFPGEIKEKMWPLPVRDLFFVGRAAEEKLKHIGINTIGKLAQADPKLLQAHLKKQGEIIYQYANGIDTHSIMKKLPDNKGYGNSMTIPYDVSSIDNAQLVLRSLCETVGARLRADHKKATCVSVSLVDIYFEHSSHQKTLTSPTNITEELYEIALQILKEFWKQKLPIRQLGVHTSKLTEEDEAYQVNLFDTNKFEKCEKLDKAIDQIRNKFGDGSVMRAAFLDSKLEHMAGALSKSKK